MRDRQVYVYNESDRIRQEAFNLSTVQDQNLLIDIVRKDPSRFRRAAAIGRISDHGLILKAALRDRSGWVRKNAIARGTLDQETLASIAKNTDEKWWVKVATLPFITDPKLIMEIARYDKSDRVREAALSFIKDQKFLKDRAKNDQKNWVREAAVVRIDDCAFVEDLATNDRSRWVREMASYHLVDLREKTAKSVHA